MRKIPCNLRLNEHKQQQNLISFFFCCCCCYYLYLSITIWCTLYIYLQYAVFILVAYLSIFNMEHNFPFYYNFPVISHFSFVFFCLFFVLFRKNKLQKSWTTKIGILKICYFVSNKKKLRRVWKKVWWKKKGKHYMLKLLRKW